MIPILDQTPFRIGWTDRRAPKAAVAAPIGKPEHPERESEREYGIVYVMPLFGYKCRVFAIRKGVEWLAVRAFWFLVFGFRFASLPFSFVFCFYAIIGEFLDLF